MTNVHNHAPSEGRGLDCPETRVDGELRGACTLNDRKNLARVVSVSNPWERPDAFERYTTIRTGGSTGGREAAGIVDFGGCHPVTYEYPKFVRWIRPRWLRRILGRPFRKPHPARSLVQERFAA